MQVRRVVSGQDARGRAGIVSDEQVASITNGNMLGVRLWGADEAARFPNDGGRPLAGPLFPEIGGYRFAIMTILPDAEQPAGGAPVGDAEFLAVLETDAPGMHATDTVDFEVVLSGEASMELDDGVHVHLAPGETFVQNGTRHRWYNRGTVPAVVAVVMIGGHKRP